MDARPEDESTTLSTTEPTPEQHATDAELRAALATAVNTLSAGFREAFVLRDLEELPTAEVANVLGVGPDAVRQRVHRARLMLRGFLGEVMGAKR